MSVWKLIKSAKTEADSISTNYYFSGMGVRIEKNHAFAIFKSCDVMVNVRCES